jgi:hypothetical protein
LITQALLDRLSQYPQVSGMHEGSGDLLRV